jgi:salicylate hydroxylase
MHMSQPPDSKVQITFQDGMTAEADAVIGCDGIRSIARDFVLGLDDPTTKPVFSGKYCYHGLVDMERAKEVLGGEAMERQLFLCKHGHVLTFPAKVRRTVNVVAHQTKENGVWDHPTGTHPTTEDNMLRDYGDHSETVRKILGVRIPSLFQDI